jgi:hypothetical protein
VIAIPDAKWGERPLLVVAAREGQVGTVLAPARESNAVWSTLACSAYALA